MRTFRLWTCVLLGACVTSSTGKGTSDSGAPGDDDDATTGIEPCFADDCVCGDPCNVTCSGTADCDVACNGADPCVVDCAGAPSCDVQGAGVVDVDCAGAGSCDVECIGAESCTVDCANGDCDVTCPATGCTVTNCGNNCTVLCGLVPQFPSGTTVTCN